MHGTAAVVVLNGTVAVGGGWLWERRVRKGMGTGSVGELPSWPRPTHTGLVGHTVDEVVS